MTKRVFFVFQADRRRCSVKYSYPCIESERNGYANARDAIPAAADAAAPVLNGAP